MTTPEYDTLGKPFPTAEELRKSSWSILIGEEDFQVSLYRDGVLFDRAYRLTLNVEIEGKLWATVEMRSCSIPEQPSIWEEKVCVPVEHIRCASCTNYKQMEELINQQSHTESLLRPPFGGLFIGGEVN
jgi:hypothetical protein